MAETGSDFGIGQRPELADRSLCAPHRVAVIMGMARRSVWIQRAVADPRFLGGMVETPGTGNTTR